MSTPVPVSLTLPQWRALAALIVTSIDFIEDPVKKKIYDNIYGELAAQLNLPVEKEEE